MTENCTNSQECCPSQLFRPPASGILAQLQSLVWNMACSPHPLDPYACPCTAPADQVATMAGDSGELYDVTLLFRGVVELETYVGGTIIAGTSNHMTSGGAPFAPPDGHNVYSLIVSNPSATYYLNGPTTVGGVFAIRYTATIQIAGGAIVTLRATTGGDATETANPTSVVAPLVTGDPAYAVTQPFDGQFMQMDAISII